MDLVAIRQSLADRMATIANFNAYPVAPGKPEVPCGIVHIGTIVVHDTLTGGSMVNFTVQILVQFSDWEAAQAAMNLYCSTGTTASVVDAVEDADATIEVDTIDPQGMIDMGDAKYGSVSLHGRILVN